jgi:hypothetical protein
MRDKYGNVPRNEGYEQVCIWPGVRLGDRLVGEEPSKEEVRTFMEYMLTVYHVHVQFLEEVKTLPDTLDGKPVKDTGGRTDTLFAVFGDDIGGFSLKKFEVGIRWIEDAMAPYNNTAHLYPERFREYMTWNPCEEAIN